MTNVEPRSGEPGERREVVEPPVDVASLLLAELLGCGQSGRWLRFGNDNGQPGWQFFQYTWYDSETDTIDTDILAIRNSDDVYAERMNNNDDLVWRHGPASLREVLAALRLLPKPGRPGAPTQPLKRGVTVDMPSSP